MKTIFPSRRAALRAGFLSTAAMDGALGAVWTLHTLAHGWVVSVDSSWPALRQMGELRVPPPKAPGDSMVALTPHRDVRKEELPERVAKQQVVALDSDMGYRSRNYAGSIWEWSAAPADDDPMTRN